MINGNKIVIVRGQSFNRQTGEPVGDPRNEEINLEENTILKDCTTVLQLKEKYEAFWNHLNSQSEHIVFVHSVKFPKGKNKPKRTR